MGCTISLSVKSSENMKPEENFQNEHGKPNKDRYLKVR